MEILITIGFIYLYLTSTLKMAMSFVLLAGTLSMIYAYFINKKKITQYAIYMIMVVVFGSFTLIFDDPKIYMLKTSFSFTMLGLALLLWPYFMKKTLFEEIVSQVSCRPATLKIIQYSSMLVCALIAISNVYIVQNYDIVTWGKFKIAIAIVTTVYCAICLSIISSPWSNSKESDSSELKPEIKE